MFKKIWQIFVNHQRNVQKIIEENEKLKRVKALESKGIVYEDKEVRYTNYDLVVKSLFAPYLTAYDEEIRADFEVLQMISRKIVFSQLIRSDGFNVPNDKIDQLYQALVNEETLNYQEINAIFLLDDFHWALFDNARYLCERDNLYPYAYHFLTHKPTIPTDFENALLFVRVA